MPRIEREGASLEWDPAAGRLAVMRFHASGTVASEEAARALSDALRAWIDATPGLWGALVDCGPLANTTPGWRAVWADFFKRHRERFLVAWFGASPLLRVTIRMFKLATRVEGEPFATEAEARAYLARTDAVRR